MYVGRLSMMMMISLLSLTFIGAAEEYLYQVNFPDLLLACTCPLSHILLFFCNPSDHYTRATLQTYNGSEIHALYLSTLYDIIKKEFHDLIPIIYVPLDPPQSCLLNNNHCTFAWPLYVHLYSILLKTIGKHMVIYSLIVIVLSFSLEER
uniref:Uncharacterized protein n=1 Tax=Glossina brevipalpis TaxID=37001 RepID=A0A1A9WZD6_9MUSC